MKQTNDKNFLQVINMFMQVVIAFFDIFFSIYIYDMSNNLTFVFCYLIFQCLSVLLFEFIIVKILTEKNYLIIYRLSFVFILLAIALIFTISSTSLYMVFVVQFVYALAIIAYYLPHEVSIMNKNTKNSISKFVGIHQVLTLIAGVISPFLSGFVIDYISYPVLFAFIILLALICFLFSFKINQGVVNEPEIKLLDFMKQAHKIKHLRLGYISHALHKASQCSVVLYLLPILLFMKFNTNFSVGIFSALATAISGIVLLIITKFYKYKNKYIIISTVTLVVTSLIVMFSSSVFVFFIYYFLGMISIKILVKYDAEMVYIATSNTSVNDYKKEHHHTFNLYDQTSKILSYIIAIVIYNYSKTVLTLSIIIFILTLLQIISSILMIKADKSFDEYLNSLDYQKTEN